MPGGGVPTPQREPAVLGGVGLTPQGESAVLGGEVLDPPAPAQAANCGARDHDTQEKFA